ncbi:MAG: TonB-dependent receptor plug domain-containing protein, partial [Bacteroidales bacterium]|nr:TonB-dependent receptor plug domain-containing protein [Bacteroidales bacterium]
KTIEINFSLKEEDQTVDEVTISATKTDKSVKAIGSQIYVIGSKRIEQTNGRNINEALMEIPGVFTEDTQHSEASVVSFRGVGLHTYVTRGILVLVDGIPITEAMGRTSFEGIDMQNAEKIEVMKGPVSALYGPNGLTGVINVIEKKPQDGLHGNFEGLIGSYGTYKVGGNLNGGKNGFN